jgi:O-acetyl-ADP-ribose deacetylase (regulator of RNase III)
MRWTLKTGNILDEPADVLICSANPHLTLSGGVGADLLARYGGAMQDYLQQQMRSVLRTMLSAGKLFHIAAQNCPTRACSTRSRSMDGMTHRLR